MLLTRHLDHLSYLVSLLSPSLGASVFKSPHLWLFFGSQSLSRSYFACKTEWARSVWKFYIHLVAHSQPTKGVREWSLLPVRGSGRVTYTQQCPCLIRMKAPSLELFLERHPCCLLALSHPAPQTHLQVSPGSIFLINCLLMIPCVRVGFWGIWPNAVVVWC